MFSLQDYIGKYAGNTRCIRCQYIYSKKEHEALHDEAARAAMEIARSDQASMMYKQLGALFGDKAAGYGFTETELHEIERATRSSIDKKEIEVNQAGNAQDQEGMRVAINAVGNLYYKAGDYTQALKSFLRGKDLPTTPDHQFELCMNMVQTAINMKNFLNASNYVQKALSVPNLTDVQRAMAQAAYGLVNLENKLYKEAARAFLEVTQHISGSFNYVIADEDIAIYAGLCALATFDREELRSKVNSSSQFKYFLSLQPAIGSAITAMINCNYVELMGVLEQYRGGLKYDLYMGDIIEDIYTDIRNRALLQYFSPFKSASIEVAAQAFNADVATIEKELAQLIMDGKLQARIDSAQKILHATFSDQRYLTFKKSIDCGERFIRDLQIVLLRSNMLKQSFILRQARMLTHL